MKGYIVSIASYTTEFFLDEQALEWIKPNPNEEENLLTAIANKFHGFSFDKQNIYIKKIYKISAYEDYLKNLELDCNREDQQSKIIKEQINEEKRKGLFITDQYYLHFIIGNNDAKISDDGKVQYVSLNEPKTIIINIANPNKISIQPDNTTNREICQDIFTKKFDDEKIRKEFASTQEEANKKIGGFNQRLLKIFFKNSASINQFFNEKFAQKKFPESPIIIYDENYHAHIATIEKRLGLLDGAISHLEDKVILTKKQVEKNIEDKRKEYTRQIEVNLISLQEKFNGIASLQLTEENISNLKNFMHNRINQFKSRFLQAKSHLAIPPDDYLEMMAYISALPKKLQSQLQLIQYGNYLEFVPFIKSCLIVALYNAAIGYRYDILQGVNEKNLGEKAQQMINEFNNKFDNETCPIAYLNQFFQVSPFEYAKQNLEGLSLPQLEKSIQDLLRNGEKKDFFNATFFNSPVTKKLVDNLSELSNYLTETLRYPVFKIIEKTIRQLAAFSLKEQIKEGEPLIKANKIDSAVNAIKYFNTYLGSLSNNNAELYIDNSVKKELKNMEDLTLQAIPHFNIYQRLIQNKQEFGQISKLVTDRTTSADTLRNKLHRSQQNIIAQLNQHQSNELVAELKPILLEHLEAISTKSDELSKAVDLNTSALPQISRTFNFSFAISTTNLNDNLRLDINTIECLENHITNAKKIADEFEMIEKQFLPLLDQVIYIQNLLSIPIKTDSFHKDAVAITHMFFQESDSFYIGDLQSHANKFYNDNIHKIENFKAQISGLNEAFNQQLPQAEAMIQKGLINHLEQLDQLIFNIDSKQASYNKKLVCHIIVNILLTDHKKNGKISFLMDLVWGAEYRGWCEDEQKSETLLFALQKEIRSAQHNPPKNLSTFYMLLNQLDIDHISGKAVCDLTTQLISYNYLANPHINLIKQNVLDHAKLGLYNVVDLVKMTPSAPKLTSISNKEKNLAVSKKERLFKHHWGKILFGLIIAGLVVSTIITAGAVPAIASFFALLIPAATTAIAGILGITAIAIASAITGTGIAGISKHIISKQEGSTLGFLKRHWWKIGLGCLVVGFIAANIFTLGGAIVVSAIAASVATSIVALGATISPAFAAAIGIGTTVLSAGALGALLGTSISIVKDYCSPFSKKVTVKDKITSFSEDTEIKTPETYDPTQKYPMTTMSTQKINGFLEKQDPSAADYQPSAPTKKEKKKKRIRIISFSDTQNDSNRFYLKEVDPKSQKIASNNQKRLAHGQ